MRVTQPDSDPVCWRRWDSGVRVTALGVKHKVLHLRFRFGCGRSAWDWAQSCLDRFAFTWSVNVHYRPNSRFRPFRFPMRKDPESFGKGNDLGSDPTVHTGRTDERTLVAVAKARRTSQRDGGVAPCLEDVLVTFQGASQCVGGVHLHSRIRAGQRGGGGRTEAGMDHAGHDGRSLCGQCDQPADGGHARCTYEPHQGQTLAFWSSSRSPGGGIRVGLWWTWTGHLARPDQ